MTYVWGNPQLIPASEKNTLKSNLKRLLNPVLVATFAGIALGLLGANEWMPQIVTEGMDLFGNFYVSMSLMVAGYLLADYAPRDMLPDKRTLLFIAVRMVAVPLGMFLLFRAINAPYYVCYFTMTTMICPCGMNTIVFPVSYGRDVNCVSRMVLGSTVASMITIPCLYMLMNAL